MMGARRGRLRGADDRLLRGYGPLVAFLAVVILMVTLVPTVAREQTVVHDSAPASIGVQPIPTEAASPSRPEVRR